MLIQIHTTSKEVENGFMLYRQERLNTLLVDTQEFFIKTDSQLEADIYNLTKAFDYIIEKDRKHQLKKREFNFTDIYKGKKKANSFSTWLEYENNVQRFAMVYTENENLYNNIRYSIRDSKYTLFFNNIITQKKNWIIGFDLMQIDEINQDVIDFWLKKYDLIKKEFLETVETIPEFDVINGVKVKW